MDQSTRIAITTAAVTAAGPVSNYVATSKVEQPDGSVVEVVTPDPAAWEAAIHRFAINIGLMANETGLVGKALAGIDTTRDDVKVFSGVVVSVVKEQQSTRGLVTLLTGTDRENKDGITKQPLPNGCEQVRTDRTDNHIGKALALDARGLIGHRVLVYVEVEAIKGGQTKVRVLRHIVDLGRDTSGDEVIGQMTR